MLEKASATVGGALKKGDIVVYESTVYPGVTEDHCVPILSEGLGARLQQGFLRGLFPRAHQSRRSPPSPVGDHQGDVGLDARSRRSRRSGLCPRRHRRHPPGEFDPHRRSLEGDREHPARRQHRPRQRARAIVQGDGTGDPRNSRGRRHEMEFPRLHARARRRALHRGRSLLPHAQGAIGRLPPGDDPGRPPHQRRHGAMGRARHRQADAAPQAGDRARAHPGDGADLQGELPRHPQHQGGRSRARARLAGRRGGGVRSAGRSGRSPQGV